MKPYAELVRRLRLFKLRAVNPVAQILAERGGRAAMFHVKHSPPVFVFALFDVDAALHASFVVAGHQARKMHGAGLAKAPHHFTLLSGRQGEFAGFVVVLHVWHGLHLLLVCAQFGLGAQTEFVRQLAQVFDHKAHGFTGLNLNVVGCIAHPVVHFNGDVALHLAGQTGFPRAAGMQTAVAVDGMGMGVGVCASR